MNIINLKYFNGLCLFVLANSVHMLCKMLNFDSVNFLNKVVDVFNKPVLNVLEHTQTVNGLALVHNRYVTLYNIHRLYID